MSLTFAAPTKKAFAANLRTEAARRQVVVSAMAPQQTNDMKIQRRSLAALFAAIALPAGNALALIPDDDDEELVEKARANRKLKLNSEREAEKAFTRKAGYTSGYVLAVVFHNFLLYLTEC